MPETLGALLSLKASGKIGGHRRRRAATAPEPPPEAGVPDMLPHIAGQFYSAPAPGTALSATGFAANTLYLIPFVVPEAGQYDRIGIRQTGAGAGNYRFGVYGPFEGTFAGLPRLLDSGNVASVAASDVLATIALQLEAGWYLLAAVWDNTINKRSFASTGFIAELGLTILNGTAMNAYATEALAFGALPATLTAPTLITTAVLPWIALRRA